MKKKNLLIMRLEWDAMLVLLHCGMLFIKNDWVSGICLFILIALGLTNLALVYGET